MSNIFHIQLKQSELCIRCRVLRTWDVNLLLVSFTICNVSLVQFTADSHLLLVLLALAVGIVSN